MNFSMAICVAFKKTSSYVFDTSKADSDAVGENHDDI